LPYDRPGERLLFTLLKHEQLRIALFGASMMRKCHENAMNIVMNGKGIPYVWFSPFEDGACVKSKT
jgi:hypothetical protein